MKNVYGVAFASVLALGLVTAAQAQETSFAPSVPNPANPYPLNPVASDGTPLARYNGVAGTYTGRSAYVPARGFVGTGAGIAGDAVGTGLGVADEGLGAGLGVADDVLR